MWKSQQLETVGVSSGPLLWIVFSRLVQIWISMDSIVSTSKPIRAWKCLFVLVAINILKRRKYIKQKDKKEILPISKLLSFYQQVTHVSIL